MIKEIILNAKPTKDDCTKCGNPMLMFWCYDCCESNDLHTCDHCGGPMSVDKDYHLECN